MRRLRGVKSLVHDAVDHTVDLVELGHTSTARGVMAVLSQIPPLAAPAAAVDTVRRITTAGILASIKGVNHLVRVTTDAGLDAFAPASTVPEAALPLRSDVIGTPAWLADAAIGIANGVVGDHLEARRNGLDLDLVLRTVDGWLTPGALPDKRSTNAGPRIVVLIHGLATTEWSWCIDAEKNLGDPAANIGTLLQRDLGYTPIYVRYNTGRHISENGRALADALRDLLSSWPDPVEEVLLIGHSMGGLVARSACHLGAERQDAWVGLTRRVVTIASPHQGARLERFGNVAARVLAAVDLPATTIPARLINGRSAGIKDLRYGYVHDEEWFGHDPDALLDDHRRSVALPDHISWCFIAATLTSAPEHPFARAFGDLLVHVESAAGPSGAPRLQRHHPVGGVDHARVQTSLQVYTIVREFCAPGPTPFLEEGPVAPPTHGAFRSA